jgi:hypothetical protein
VDGQVSVGRGIAAVGIILGLVAIWVDWGPAGSLSYWSYDGTLGGLLLILELAAILALIGAFATNDRDYDLAYGALGGVGFGIYLFYPAVFAFDQWDQLDPGAWLGLCSALVFIGASIATWSSDRPLRRPSGVGAVTALVGLGLVVAGLFPTFVDHGGSYWSITGFGHSFGILIIILVILEALAIFSAWSSSAGIDSAVLLGAIIFGAAIAIPDQSAFNQFGDLGAGAWLMGIGGLLVAIGVLAMWLMADEAAPAPATAPPPGAPPPTATT